MKRHNTFGGALCMWVLPVAAFATASSPSKFDPSGIWVGVYQSYPHVVRMTLQVPATAETRGSVEGDLRLEPLFETRGIGIGGSPLGVVKATVKFDASLRTVTVQPDRASYRNLGVNVPGFVGVYDSQRSLIAGTLATASGDASPYFIFGRPDVAPKAFLSRLEAAGLQRNNTSVLGVLAGKFGAGSSSGAKLREWAAQYLKEYPDVDVMHTPLDTLAKTTRNLFGDESFRPYFGVTYDELGAGQLARILRDIQQTPMPRGNFPEERANGVIRVVDRPFLPMATGTFMAPDIVLSVMAKRVLSNWRSQILREVESAPESTAAWQFYEAAQGAESLVFGYEWPSKRVEFSSAIVAAQARTADPLLQMGVDALLASLQANNPLKVSTAIAAIRSPRPAPTTAKNRGAASLPVDVSSADPSLQTVASYASARARDTQVARLSAQLKIAAASECDADRRMVSSLPGGLAGLEESARRFVTLQNKYAAYAERSTTCGSLDDLQQARRSLLTSAQPELLARVRGAGNVASLTSTLSTYVGLPSDRNEPAAAPVLSAARQREGELTRQQQVAKAQAVEERRLGACARASDAREGSEPTEREMCNALANNMRGQQQAIDGMARSCNDVSSPSANVGTAIACLMGGSIQAGGGVELSISQFEKLACTSAAAAGKPGFFCDYTIRQNMGNQTLDAMAASFGAEMVTARFVKQKGSWIAIQSASN